MENLVGRNNRACPELLKSLADETRLNIVRQLIEGPRSVRELNQLLEIEQTLFSHHLKVLRKIGLVVAERNGKSVIYQLAAGVNTPPGQTLDLGCCRLEF